jgi:isopentenyl-diphosphate delta-isomerase
MNDELIPVVDEQDNIVDYKRRSEIVKEDIYRVSALWIENSKGQVLLAQRAFSKKNDPGKWGPAVAGTVEKGETYESNIIKEAEEELDIINVKFTMPFEKIRHSGEHNFFAQYFLAVIDKDLDEFNFDKREVNDIKWFDREELKHEIELNPDRFLKSLTVRINLFVK